jgi:hypothetical protein
MKTIEDQLRAYGSQLTSIADEHEAVTERSPKNSGGVDYALASPDPVKPKRNKWIPFAPIAAAAAAIMALVSSHIFGHTTANAQKVRFSALAAKPGAQRVVIDELPQGFAFDNVTEIPTNQTFSNLLIIGESGPTEMIESVVTASQSKEDMYADGSSQLNGSIQLKNYVGKTVRVITEHDPKKNDRITQITMIAPLEGCGFAYLYNGPNPSEEVLADQLAKLKCSNGRLTGTAPAGQEVLYNGPMGSYQGPLPMTSYTDGKNHVVSIEAVAATFPEQLREIIERLSPELTAVDTQRISGREVSVRELPGVGINYAWVDDDVQYALTADRTVSIDDVAKIIRSVRSAADDEWQKMLAPDRPV